MGKKSHNQDFLVGEKIKKCFYLKKKKQGKKDFFGEKNPKSRKGYSFLRGKKKQVKKK